MNSNKYQKCHDPFNNFGYAFFLHYTDDGLRNPNTIQTALQSSTKSRHWKVRPNLKHEWVRFSKSRIERNTTNSEVSCDLVFDAALNEHTVEWMPGQWIDPTRLHFRRFWFRWKSETESFLTTPKPLKKKKASKVAPWLCFDAAFFQRHVHSTPQSNTWCECRFT